MSSFTLQKTDFVRTPLRGVGLSRCVIDGFTVSDSRDELIGAKIGMGQAPAVAQLLGVEILP